MEDITIDVLLLDCRIITLPYQNYYYKDLVDLILPLLGVCDSSNKEVFGFLYTDICERMCWLHPDKRLFDHSIPQNENRIKLSLRIRFHSSSLIYSDNPLHYFQIYLDARRSLFQGNIPSSVEQLIHLISFNLLIEYGSYLSEDTLTASVQVPGRLPPWALMKASTTDWVNVITPKYLSIRHLSRGEAILRFLEMITALPLYGVHLCEVMKEEEPQFLGIAPMGIITYTTDAGHLRELNMYPWRSISNIYGRNFRFSMEIYTSASTQLSKIRSSSGVTEVNIVGWHLHSEQSTKILLEDVKLHWAHYKYLEIQSSNHKNLSHSNFIYDMNELFETGGLFNLCIPLQLDNSTTMPGLDAALMSYIPLDVINNRNTEFERPHNFSWMNDEKSSEEDVSPHSAQVKELYNRYHHLKTLLQSKEEEFRKLCLQEAAITGELPSDYKRQPQDRGIVSRRCVRTGYNLSPLVKKRSGSMHSLSSIAKSDNSMKEELADMELQLELQSQILHANKKLSKDPSLPKANQKQYRNAAMQSNEKLSSMKYRLRELRNQANNDRSHLAYLQVPDGVRSGLRSSGSTMSMFDFSISSSRSTEDVSRMSPFSVTPIVSNHRILETSSAQSVSFSNRTGSNSSCNSIPARISKPSHPFSKPPICVPVRNRPHAAQPQPPPSHIRRPDVISSFHRKPDPILSVDTTDEALRHELTHVNTAPTQEIMVEEDWRQTVQAAKVMKHRRSFFYPQNGFLSDNPSDSASPYYFPSSPQNSSISNEKSDAVFDNQLKAAHSSSVLPRSEKEALVNFHTHLSVPDDNHERGLSFQNSPVSVGWNASSSDDYWEANL